MHWDTLKQDNDNTVGGDGGCRVGEVRAGTTSPMPDHNNNNNTLLKVQYPRSSVDYDHKGFMLQ